MATQLWTGSDDMSIRVWDTEAAECLHTLTGHTGSVLSLTLTSTAGPAADGGAITVMLSSSSDGTIRMWSVSGEFPCLQVVDACARVSTLACMGPEVWSCGQHPDVTVWDSRRMTKVAALQGHKTCVAWRAPCACVHGWLQ